VIFGLIQDDLRRLLTVHRFMERPGRPFPFAKPRSTSVEEGLRPVNTPLPEPSRLLAHAAVATLPNLEYEPGYHDWEWQRHWFHASRLLRFVTTVIRRWPVPRPEFSETVIQELGTGVLHTFIDLAKRSGVHPVVVYFSSKGAGDVDSAPDDSDGGDRGVARHVLHAAGIDFVDLTSCLADVPEARRFATGKSHYSLHGNNAVAACLLP